MTDQDRVAAQRARRAARRGRRHTTTTESPEVVDTAPQPDTIGAALAERQRQALARLARAHQEHP